MLGGDAVSSTVIDVLSIAVTRKSPRRNEQKQRDGRDLEKRRPRALHPRRHRGRRSMRWNRTKRRPCDTVNICAVSSQNCGTRIAPTSPLKT